MGHNSIVTEELERMDCEIMTIQYDWCGFFKEFTGSKKEVIARFKEIQANPQTMKLIVIIHPQKTAA
jgi:hypothetical protein